MVIIVICNNNYETMTIMRNKVAIVKYSSISKSFLWSRSLVVPE